MPDLATKTYKDIIDEMVASIPKYSNKWTNYNASDPGIIILEFLSWIAEVNLYRINNITKDSYINFLRLVAGVSGSDVEELLERLKKDPSSDRAHIKILEFLKELETDLSKNGKTEKSIIEIKSAALEFLNSQYRAVTEDNFRSLAIEATQTEKNAKVRRAIIQGYPDRREIEIVIVSDNHDRYEDLIKIVKNYLEPRKLIGTRIIVKEPVYTAVKIHAEIVSQFQTEIRKEKIRDNIKQRILDHLDPLIGGYDKEGWSYGRTLTIFEIDRIIEETEGVDHVKLVTFDDDLKLTSKKIDGLIHPVHISIEVIEDEEGK